MTSIDHSIATAALHLRPLDISRDLTAVADLVELCFEKTLDPDGREYLQKMREASRSSRYLQWANQRAMDMLGPLAGFVWEEDDRIIGNLSLIPFLSWRKHTTLIANVAVHPEYRRRGIARALTQAALEHLHKQAAESTWLHVRDDNPAAFELYLSLGFKERFRRTTWQNDLESPTPTYTAQRGLTISSRQARHWPQQQEWMSQIYPPDLSWYLPIRANLLRPGMWGTVQRIINDLDLQQWSAQLDGQLLGVLTWQASHGYSDYLWLCPKPQNEDLAIQVLLQHAVLHLARWRTLSLDYPYAQGQTALQKAGFHPRHTLIWMQAKGNGDTEESH